MNTADQLKRIKELLGAVTGFEDDDQQYVDDARDAVQKLIEALAEQPAQRPIKTFHDGKAWPVQEQAQQEPFGFAVMENPIAPPVQRTWVGLTDEEIGVCLDVGDGSMSKIIQAIEAKLRSKNEDRN